MDLKFLYFGPTCGDVQCTVQVGIEHATRLHTAEGTALPKYTIGDHVLEVYAGSTGTTGILASCAL